MQPHRSSATLLTPLFVLLLVYASLFPFSDWRDQGINPFAFLQGPWPRYWSRFDVVANFLGYMPLGFLATVALLRTRLLAQPALLVALGCSALSVLMEALQTYLPTRVPQLSDWILNSAGGFCGALLAQMLARWGVLARWSQLRRNWFVREARSPLVLLALWPVALLFPPAAPFALGQVRERLHLLLDSLVEGTPLASLIDAPNHLLPLTKLGELICVATGFLAPCLLAYAIALDWRRRLVLLIACIGIALLASALSSSLSFSPEHAWAWMGPQATAGLIIGISLAALFLPLGRRMCLALMIIALIWQLSLINLVPATPYFAQTLQSWEQGRFIRFHGLAQWVGWLWPYAAIGVALMALTRHEPGLRR